MAGNTPLSRLPQACSREDTLASPGSFSPPLRRWEQAFYARLAEEGIDPKSPRAMYIHVACRMVVGDGPADDLETNSLGLGGPMADVEGCPPDPQDRYHRCRALTGLTREGRWAERGFFEWLISHWPIAGSPDGSGRWRLARSWSWDEIVRLLPETNTDEPMAAHLAAELERVGALRLIQDQQRIVRLALEDA